MDNVQLSLDLANVPSIWGIIHSGKVGDSPAIVKLDDVSRVSWGLMSDRERAILRSLLEYSLHTLDEYEK